MEKAQAGLFSVIRHSISTSKYNPFAARSYIELPKELDPPRKELINNQNIDGNECCKWSIVRYFNPSNHHSGRIAKADKLGVDKVLIKKRDFKDIKFPVKIRDIHNIKVKNSLGISAFGYENKEKHPICV